MKDEIWKDVPGYEGVYQISNKGRVLSVSRKVAREDGFFVLPSKLLKPAGHKNKGSLYVYLRKNGKSNKKYVAALVLTAFVGPRPTGCAVGE